MQTEFSLFEFENLKKNMKTDTKQVYVEKDIIATVFVTHDLARARWIEHDGDGNIGLFLGDYINVFTTDGWVNTNICNIDAFLMVSDGIIVFHGNNRKNIIKYGKIDFQQVWEISRNDVIGASLLSNEDILIIYSSFHFKVFSGQTGKIIRESQQQHLLDVHSMDFFVFSMGFVIVKPYRENQIIQFQLLPHDVKVDVIKIPVDEPIQYMDIWKHKIMFNTHVRWIYYCTDNQIIHWSIPMKGTFWGMDHHQRYFIRQWNEKIFIHDARDATILYRRNLLLLQSNIIFSRDSSKLIFGTVGMINILQLFPVAKKALQSLLFGTLSSQWTCSFLKGKLFVWDCKN